MAGNVHAHLLIGDHPGADLGQGVHHAVDGLLVAGNQRRGQDDQIVRGDGDAAVLAARHPRQRRHRLALGAGGDQHHPLGRHLLGGGDVDDVAVLDVQEAEFLGDAHVAHHRPADERHPAAQRHCGVDDLLHPVDVGGEAGHDDPLAVGPAHQPVQVGPDFTLRRPDAGQFGVGRVAQEQVHTLVAQARHPRQVGRAAVQGQLVELDVAGVQHGARPSVHGDRERIGNRVIDREVLALEDAVRASGALGHLDEHRIDPVLATFRGDEGQRELGADDRDVSAQLEQERDRTDVVLVRVREHQGLDVVETMLDVAQVRQDQVHAGFVMGGEQHPAVDDQ